MMRTKYVVTARNRLTGDREAISLPCSKQKADELKQKYLARKKVRSVYTYPKVRPFEKGLFDAK